MGRRRAGSLRNGCLITHGLPVSVAADPDAGVAIGAAEVFAQLMAFDIGAGGDDGSIAIHPHNHIRDIQGFVTELATAAGANGFLLGGYLAERGYGDVVFGEGTHGEIGVAAQTGFLGLALHIDDLADDLLLAGVEARSGVKGDVLRGKCR